MNYFLGMALSIITYLALAIFIATTAVKAITLVRAAKTSMSVAGKRNISSPSGLPCPAALRATGDVLFFIRLLKTNDVLWAGEWLFHFSFLLVLLRHLRYCLYPVPGCVAWLQTVGIIAGYLLAASLLYVVTIKRVFMKAYMPLYNLFLLGLLLSLCATGLLMKTVVKVDLVAAKAFILGIVRFSPQAFPLSPLFFAHFILFLLFILCLPTHAVAAPLTILEARIREDQQKHLFHEDGE
jgi:nitrate reductase gamma subunit